MRKKDSSEDVPVLANGGSRPIPDPTVLTDLAIGKLKESLTSYIDGKFNLLAERMNGADEATRLRLAVIDGIPDLIDQKIAASRDVIETRLAGMDALAESRAELGKDALTAAFNAAKEAVAAALTAQKEAAAKQDEANAKAIDKSEKATAKTIETNQELNATKTDALSKGLDEVKQQVTRIVSREEGSKAQVDTRQASNASTFAAVGAVMGVVGLIVGAAISLLRH